MDAVEDEERRHLQRQGAGLPEDNYPQDNLAGQIVEATPQAKIPRYGRYNSGEASARPGGGVINLFLLLLELFPNQDV